MGISKSISAGALLAMMSFAAHAAIITTTQTGAAETTFDSNISTHDLIQAGATSLGSVTSSRAASFAYSGANDGTAVHTSGLAYWGGTSSPDVYLTYYLTGSATGYNIASVNSIFGWQDVRYRHAAQNWDLLVQTVGNATFTQIASVHLNPWGAYDPAAGSSDVTLTDTSGIIASGVTAVQFHLMPYGHLGDTGYTAEVGVIRELDIFGVATLAAADNAVPEPATGILLGLGAVALAGARRRPRV